MASFAQAERSALHGHVSPGHHGRAGITGLTIAERTDISLATVIVKRGKRDQLVAAVDTAFGLKLPLGAKRVTGGGLTFAGTGPGQWIVSAEKADGLLARLRSRLGPFAAVTDQSDARLVLHLSGPRVRDVLAKGVPLDLHPKVFKPGDVATTLVAYIGTQVDRLDETAWQLSVPRSMAGSFWSWLSASAAEFGYDVVVK